MRISQIVKQQDSQKLHSLKILYIYGKKALLLEQQIVMRWDFLTSYVVTPSINHLFMLSLDNILVTPNYVSTELQKPHLTMMSSNIHTCLILEFLYEWCCLLTS